MFCWDTIWTTQASQCDPIRYETRMGLDTIQVNDDLVDTMVKTYELLASNNHPNTYKWISPDRKE
jgi:hypothetical protein